MYTYTAVDYNPFEDNEITKVALMNDSQKEIWLSCVLGEESASLGYNESISLEFKGPLNFPILQSALKALVAQHEALRSVISANGETLLINKEIPFTLKEVNISLLTEEKQKDYLTEFIKKEMNLPFDLYQGPLFRFHLHKLQADLHRLTIVIHHIIADGWSLGVMIDGLSKFYNAALSGQQYPLECIPQMSDFAIAQQAHKASPEFKTTKEYWFRKFERGTPILQIPVDFPRINPRSYKGKRLDFELPATIISDLQKASKQANTSLVITLLCAFEIFLKKLTKQKEVIVGLPTAGQLASDKLELVSHCVSLLPIKSSLKENESPILYLARRKKEILDDLDHQNITFGEIIKDISISRSKSSVPLVPIIFNVDMGMDEGVSFDQLELHLISNPREFENFDIFVNLSGNPKHMTCEWSYNVDIFRPETIIHFHDGYLSAISSIIGEQNAPIELDLQTVNTLPSVSSVKSNEPYEDIDLITQFERSVKKHHANRAISSDNESLSYTELNEKINQLAAYLRSQEVKVGDRIGLSTDRSIEILIAMMAIIKVGAVFVPIDSKYPKDRKGLLLNNIQPSFIITSKKHNSTKADEYGSFTEYFVEDLLVSAQSLPSVDISVSMPSHRPIYILHTSGSTGIPKGVSMNQPALSNIFQWQVRNSIADQHSATLQFSPLNFDVSFQEIFSTFFTGGMLVLVSDEVRTDPAHLLNYLEYHHINRLFLPFVALQSLVEFADSQNQFPSALQEVITAGEQLKITPQIKRFFTALPNCTLYNHYGPTETHIVTSLKLDGDPSQWPALPSIGKEVDHTEHFILNDQLESLPMGEIGELCLSGICLADGYVNLPELTSDRFPYWKHPEKGIVRIYRSGDLAKRLPDGNIEFLGRIDHQIKIRGFRVELSEIEYYLNQEKEIKQSVVIAEKNEDLNNIRLIGYVTTDQENIIPNKEDGVAGWKERWDRLYKDAEIEQVDHEEESIDDLVFKQLAHFEDAEKHAKEWLDETLYRIQEIIDKKGGKKPFKILEIGCGGGQLLYTLAANCTAYYASDYSETAIHNIQEHINQNPEKWKNVILSASDASDLTFLKEDQVDLIIINSVIQYFPNEPYLVDLIEKSLQFLHPEGCLFLGDVQASETLERCLTSEQLHHMKDDTTLMHFREIMEHQMISNEELVLDPSFFYSLQSKIPAISHIDVQIRKGKFINETTKYHYDTWIYKDPAIAYAQPDHILDWKHFNSLHFLQEALALHPNDSFQIQHIPNRRCLYDIAILDAIEVSTASTTISEIRNKVNVQQSSGENPDSFWKIGNNLGFNTYVRWMNSGIDNQLEVIYIPSNGSLKACPPLNNLHEKALHKTKHVQILHSADIDEKCNKWRNKLKQKLPDYMIPDRIVVLNQLPLTSTGKIDRKELPHVVNIPIATGETSLPSNDVEHFLEKLWRKILSLEQVSTQADFFDIGGHSLLAVKVIIAIEKEYGTKLPLATLFDYPNIQKLALKIIEIREGKQQPEDENDWNALVNIKRSGSNLPVYMIHGAGLNVLVFKSFVRYLEREQPVYGMQALGQNGKSELSDDIHEIARKYNEDILKNDPHGPYLLGGYSYGGFLAYEMARQLTAMGKEVRMLAIFDTYVDEFDTSATSIKNLGSKFKFTLKTIIKQPRRYFSNLLFLAGIKLKHAFNKNHIDHVESFSHRSEIIQAYIKAFKNYNMTPQSIEISLFKAKHTLQYYEDSKYMGWGNFVDKVNVYEIPGEHKTIFFPPNDRGLAKVFQAVMKEKN